MVDRRTTRRRLLASALALAGLTAVGVSEPEPCPTTVEEIAFTSDREGITNVYVMNADGAGLHQVTRIAYQSRRAGWQLFTVAVDGSDERRVSSLISWSPSWSPDGESLAFAAPRGGGTQIYVVSLRTEEEVQLTDNGATNGRPAWSPDGARIAFHSNVDGAVNVFVMDRDGRNPIRITQSESRDFLTSWSPDGERLAFCSKRDGNREIYTIHVDGTRPTRLTFDPTDDMLPTWSPDGEWIAFVSRRDGNDEIYLMRPNGSCVTRLTDSAGSDMYPTWRPVQDQAGEDAGNH